MTESLGDYLFSVGIKGQDKVLSTTEKLKKDFTNLKKNFSKGGGFDMGNMFKPRKGSGFSNVRAEINARKQVEQIKRQNEFKSGREELSRLKQEQMNNSTLMRAGKTLAEASKTFAAGAASLNPTEFIKGAITAVGSLAGGVPFLSGVAEGAAQFANLGVSMASGAVSSARENAGSYYNLATRNAASSYYGGNIKFSSEANKEQLAAEKKFRDKEIAINKKYDTMASRMKFGERSVATVTGTSSIQKSREKELADLQTKRLEAERKGELSTSGASGKWTERERADLIAAVSSSFGKIQKPLADTLGSMIREGKFSAESMTRVASGDWASLGTDKAFFIQQIADQFKGLPPTLAQSFQNSLLKSQGQMIREASPDQLAAQRTVKAWESADENQVRRLYGVASTQLEGLIGLNQKLNNIQVDLVRAGGGMAGALNDAANTLMQVMGKLKSGGGR